VFPKDPVRYAALSNIVQEARPAQHPELGGRHGHLAADLNAKLRDAPVVGERLPILDQVAEDGYGIQPAFDVRHRVCNHWGPSFP
jgi:hypothetical protein